MGKEYTSFYAPLFAGPTQVQHEKMQRKKRIEIAFMKALHGDNVTSTEIAQQLYERIKRETL